MELDFLAITRVNTTNPVTFCDCMCRYYYWRTIRSSSAFHLWAFMSYITAYTLTV